MNSHNVDLLERVNEVFSSSKIAVCDVIRKSIGLVLTVRNDFRKLGSFDCSGQHVAKPPLCFCEWNLDSKKLAAK